MTQNLFQQVTWEARSQISRLKQDRLCWRISGAWVVEEARGHALKARELERGVRGLWGGLSVQRSVQPSPVATQPSVSHTNTGSEQDAIHRNDASPSRISRLLEEHGEASSNTPNPSYPTFSDNRL
ncbi:hypothetical protein BJ138DRAFT_1128960 [Hygrophoropsis aurantiaca]|uniref:Uncharacterized protein n=1 Tax=Hygrophoropsis aurantiaca TaxID=72124 RepID=A0ACB8A3W9_9AGAM|nr:hypothetical protein BJ138DRAFT_1128960 [Hygrophoropsis aurantiaca]